VTSSHEIRVREADLEDPAQAEALALVIDSYARGPGGQNAPLSGWARGRLALGLRSHPAAMVLFAEIDAKPVGAAVCFWGFSTFAGKPSLNIHDLAVLPAVQGRGAGSALLSECERRARERGCCKLSLEVHDSNHGAKRLYEANGFGPWDRATLFVTKPL
jgi:ribosomal protein S18 acetylase RimI-like enzyme